MATKSRKSPPSRRPWQLTAVTAGAAIVAVAVGAFLIFRPFAQSDPVPWARLGTQDVHSLAFLDGDPQRVLFGHHGGLLESLDGGKTWASLPVRDDAMSMSPASDSSIVIAGHEVFVASRDGGQTWEPIKGDLPSLDIHGFTRDPVDPGRMWAYLATGGLWGSTDFGARWTRLRDDNVLFPTAVRVGETTRLFGVDARGLNVSDDGGTAWTVVGEPPTYPMTAFASSADGSVLYAGSPDGLFQSRDGGQTWGKARYGGSVFAVATSPDGQVVAVVSRETEFFRSTDGGSRWLGPT